MSLLSRDYRVGLRKRLRENYKDAVLYIKFAAEDSKEAFLKAVENVYEANRVGFGFHNGGFTPAFGNEKTKDDIITELRAEIEKLKEAQ